jgi:hypothetical protein
LGIVQFKNVVFRKAGIVLKYIGIPGIDQFRNMVFKKAGIVLKYIGILELTSSRI